MDPRKLARGEWNECVYVGGLLVHVAKKEDLVGDDEAMVDVDPEVSVSEGLKEEGISSARAYRGGYFRGALRCPPLPSTTRG